MDCICHKMHLDLPTQFLVGCVLFSVPLCVCVCVCCRFWARRLNVERSKEVHRKVQVSGASRYSCAYVHTHVCMCIHVHTHINMYRIS